jgi:hypothetical protein
MKFISKTQQWVLGEGGTTFKYKSLNVFQRLVPLPWKHKKSMFKRTMSGENETPIVIMVRGDVSVSD